MKKPSTFCVHKSMVTLPFLELLPKSIVCLPFWPEIGWDFGHFGLK